MRRITRPFRHAAAAFLLVLVSGFLRILPRAWVGRAGYVFGLFIGCIARRQNRLVKRQLSAYLDTPPAAGKTWGDLGRRLFELMDAKRQLTMVRISDQGRQIFEEARSEGRGILVATLHLGHWELMAAALVQAGYAFKSIAAKPKSSPIHDRLSATRASLGIRIIHPGRGARDALRELKAGGTVSLFIDQNTGERSRTLKFLGHPAPTPLTFDRLQEASQAISLMVWNYRSEEGHYTIEVARIDGKDPLKAATRHAEQLIRTYPEQWIWFHKRWDNDVDRSR